MITLIAAALDGLKATVSTILDEQQAIFNKETAPKQQETKTQDKPIPTTVVNTKISDESGSNEAVKTIQNVKTLTTVQEEETNKDVLVKPISEAEKEANRIKKEQEKEEKAQLQLKLQEHNLKVKEDKRIAAEKRQIIQERNEEIKRRQQINAMV